MTHEQPTLIGDGVVVRPGRPEEAPHLHEILCEPSVAQWWGEPEPAEQLAVELSGTDEEQLLIIDIDGVVAGGIQYSEETTPRYRHAGIDIFLGDRFQGRGIGTQALRLLARYLIEQRKHHRLTIDPAAANTRAIRSYTNVGFRPVGIMRQYEAGPNGEYHDGLLMDLLADELR